MTRYVSAAELQDLVGTELEPSEWLEISQDRVNEFADATNDHQFIHVDLERAKASPFGGTIAHGFLTLSLLTHLLSEPMVVPKNTAMTINYGSDKVRFLKPVAVGQRVRAKQQLVKVNEKKPGQWLLKTSVNVEIEGEETPALIAEILFMHFVEA
ncbi:MAG: MaoC family dehydratase [Gammaproteobacteria bacterium]|nr:MaoC family dehydratase [Gammaproteobacteria bacterium]MDH3410316.1 MaoC family dehydratase [Gammaproteobacteria bacterium]MDH3553180.1 MaoC family dehydratase [Gammaproteobacteria bacterium]